MSALVDEWVAERVKHPFFGEKLSSKQIAEIWDRSAGTYDNAQLGDIPEKIFQRMMDVGAIGRTAIDIGSGPGTYGLRFSDVCENVVCLDESQAMLDRLRKTVESKNIRNIGVVRADWLNYDSKEKFDTVFSSLCPPLNCPGCIMKMELYAKGVCAYVSSMNDDRGSVHMDIWKRFGKDYTFNGYNTMYPYRYLREEGRTPTLDIFETSSPSSMSIGEVVKYEIEKFSTYMTIDDARRDAIVDVATSHSEDGRIYFDGKKKVGLLMWSPVRRS